MDARSPRKIKIAVCGHRRLSDEGLFDQAIHTAKERICVWFPDRRFQVLSCLAEGADRLLARHLVHSLAAELIIVLPLPENEYLKDFQNNALLEEYQSLKLLALEVLEPKMVQARPQAYQQANHYLVENCDLLLVIWDGTPARGIGGTGDLVELARQVGRPLVWIQITDEAKPGSLIEERLENLP